MLLAQETLNSFLLLGISSLDIFFMKKEKIVVVKSNIDYKFSSENLKYIYTILKKKT